MKQLRRVTGERLADATKAKIRNLMSVLFNDAIRYEWLEQARNPITLVRQSAQRKWTPEILEPHEIQNLLLQLNSCSRREAQTQAVFELRAIPVSTSATGRILPASTACCASRSCCSRAAILSSAACFCWRVIRIKK